MSKLTMLIAAIGLAGATAFGSYWLGHAHAERPADQVRPREGAAQSRDDADKAERIRGDAVLAGAIERLDRRLAALELKGSVTEPSALFEPATQVGADEAADPAQAEERHTKRLAAIDEALRVETPDRAWAFPTEVDLRAAVDSAISEGAKFSIENLKCLTSLCEMVLTAPAEDDFTTLPQRLPTKITGMSRVDVSPPTTLPDGRATVTCRLFRQGHPEPGEGVL